jgi:hypothetical protein
MCLNRNFTDNELTELEEKFEGFTEYIELLKFTDNDSNLDSDLDFILDMDFLSTDLKEIYNPLHYHYKNCAKCYRLHSISEFKKKKETTTKVCIYCLKKRHDYWKEKKDYLLERRKKQKCL